MKILIVSDAWHPQVNGVVRTYEHLKDTLVSMGYDVKVIGPADFPIRVPLIGYSEIKLAVVPYGRLKRMIDAYNPDHLHLATEGPLGAAGRKYAIKYNVEFTTSYHTHFPDYVAKRVKKYFPFWADAARKMAIKRIRNFHAPAKAIMIATQSLEDELQSWGFKAPMTRLTRGVDMKQFYPGDQTIFPDLPRPIAIYVGRVAIEKSIHKFLEMDWQGSKVVVGHGPSMDYFIKRHPDVHFAGKKIGEELAAYYRSSDVFVFPSKTDTFGIVLIEALASGLPIAAYNVTGPKDIVTKDFLGVLDDDLSQAAYQALECGNPQERVQHIKQYYTWENAGQQFIDAAFKKVE